MLFGKETKGLPEDLLKDNVKDKIKGSYENKPVDLLFSRDSLNCYKIEGVFNDKKVNLLLKENSNGYTLEGNDINLKINNNHFFFTSS